jgi:hypothetical protein
MDEKTPGLGKDAEVVEASETQAMVVVAKVMAWPALSLGVGLFGFTAAWSVGRRDLVVVVGGAVLGLAACGLGWLLAHRRRAVDTGEHGPGCDGHCGERRVTAAWVAFCVGVALLAGGGVLASGLASLAIGGSGWLVALMGCGLFAGTPRRGLEPPSPTER